MLNPDNKAVSAVKCSWQKKKVKLYKYQWVPLGYDPLILEVFKQKNTLQQCCPNKDGTKMWVTDIENQVVQLFQKMEFNASG